MGRGGRAGVGHGVLGRGGKGYFVAFACYFEPHDHLPTKTNLVVRFLFHAVSLKLPPFDARQTLGRVQEAGA
jgi:hypothetical protein